MKQLGLFDAIPAEISTTDSRQSDSDKAYNIVFSGRLAFLLNMTGSNPHTSEILGIALYANSSEMGYVPVSHRGEDNLKNGLNILKAVLEDPGVVKTSHDIKTQMTALKKKGIILNGEFRDTMIASYLLDPNRANHSIESVAETHLGRFISTQPKRSAKKEDTSLQTIEEGSQSSCERLHAICQLEDLLFKEKLTEAGLDRIYKDLEEPVIKILSDMELAGIRIDTEMLSILSEELSTAIEQVGDRIYSISGERFNINSPRQLAEVLFNKMRLKPIRKTKTGYSTDNETLQQLAISHELPAEILNYRMLFKLKSTYIDALPPVVNSHTGRIHTTFHQCVTATGRLSSSEPNLQNIPIRGEWGSRIRHAFTAKEGHILISSDYSQIELRLLAHMSGDERLTEGFKRDMDIHASTASLLFKVPEDKVDREMRRVAKVVNFGILYGMSPYGLSEALRIGTTEAAQYIEDYFKLYGGVKTYIEKAVQSARASGYAATLFGRKRAITDINSPNTNMRQQAERLAINTPIQGTAADLIKVAMINIDHKINEAKLRTRMILQIHDELLFESPEDELEQVIALVKREMEGAASLNVPLKVDIHYGKNWGDAH